MDTFLWSCGYEVRRALLRVELDDQLFVDRHREIGALRKGLHRPGERDRIELQPVGHAPALRKLHRLLDAGDVAAPLPHADDVARTNEIRGDVHLATVHAEVAVPDELAGLRARGREAEPIRDVVEAPLEELEKRLTGHALRLVRHLEVATELGLEHAVDAAELLLLAELDRILGKLRPRLAVL